MTPVLIGAGVGLIYLTGVTLGYGVRGSICQSNHLDDGSSRRELAALRNSQMLAEAAWVAAEQLRAASRSVHNVSSDIVPDGDA